MTSPPWSVVLIAPPADSWDGIPTDLTWYGYTVGLHPLGHPELWASARSIEGTTVDLAVLGVVLNRLGLLMVERRFPWGGRWTYSETEPVPMTFWIPGGPLGRCFDPTVQRDMAPHLADPAALIVPLTWSSPLLPDPT